MFTFKALLVMLITAIAAVPVTIAGRLIAAGGLPNGGPISSQVGAPGPVAGVGLPVLAAVGAIIWIRTRKRRS